MITDHGLKISVLPKRYPSAIALDMDEIGRYSVNALDEYLSLGHSNNYYSVNQHVITKENTKDYRTEDGK